jgi:hypothetical protein
VVLGKDRPAGFLAVAVSMVRRKELKLVLNIRRSALLASLVAAVLFLLPFQWIVVAPAGPLTLKPVHVPLVALVVLSPLLVSGSSWVSTLSGRAGAFVAVFFLFWLITLASVAWAGDMRAGLANVVKTGLYFFFFVVMSASVVDLCKRERVAAAVAAGVLLGAFGYLFYNIVLFHRLGYNYLGESVAAIVSADVTKLKFWFFQNLFNCSFSGSCLVVHEDEDTFGAALRNTVVGSQVTYIVLVGMVMASPLPRLVKNGLKVAAGVCVVLVLVSMSRSNTIVLLLVLLFGAALPWYRSGIRISKAGVALIAIAIGGFFVWAVSSELPKGLAQVLSDRAAESLSDPRVEMFRNALLAISSAPLLGHGAGTEVLEGNGNLLAVHNIFLATWVEQGLVGLVFAIGWYAVVLLTMMQAYRARPAYKEQLEPRWVALLPVLMLFRAQVSGGGESTLVDWMALALFYGLAVGQSVTLSSGERNTVAR